MANQHDTADSGLEVQFYAGHLMQFHAPSPETEAGITYRLVTRPEGYLEILNKWLYIFYSPGEKYAVSNANGAYEGRTDNSGAYQHIADFRMKAKNPPRTTSPQEHAQFVKYEVYFDEHGYLYYLDIEKNWDQPRHERPHPQEAFKSRHGDKWEEARRSLMRLPLVDRNQQPIRYYFLLSTVRLGKNALTAATAPGGGDGLTLWATQGEWKDGEWEPCYVLSGPTPELIGRLCSIPDEDKRNKELKYLCTIKVVDPYHLAAQINAKLYWWVLLEYAEILNGIAEGKGIPNLIEDRHLRTGDNKGSIFDLYFIAKILDAAQTTLMKEGSLSILDLDRAAVDQVIRFVDHELEGSKNACDMCALYLANWLASPAHELIDIAVTEDTCNVKDDAAPADRAYGLVYWYTVTAMLGATTSGSLFLARQNELTAHNPAKMILWPYQQKELELGSIDDQAFLIAVKVLPDLMLQQVFTVLDETHRPGYKMSAADRYIRAAKNARRIADLMNNIRYFPSDLTTFPKTDGGGTQWKDFAPYIDNGMWLWETGIPKTVESLLDRKAKSAAFKTIDELIEHNEQAGVAPIGAGLLKVHRAAKAAGKAFPYVKVFVAFVNVITSSKDAAEEWAGDKSASRKVLAVMQPFMSVQGIFEACMALRGVEPASWGDVLEMMRIDSKYSLTLKGAGIAFFSVCAIISAVWTIITNFVALWDAHRKHDTSVEVGAAISMFGGGMLLIGGIAYLAGGTATTASGWIAVCASTPWTLLAGLLVLAGGLVIMLTQDNDLEVFVNSSYFARDPGARNWRGFGGSDHWAGPEPTWKWEVDGHSRNWPVVHQRFALANLLSGFTVTPEVEATIEDRTNLLGPLIKVDRLALTLRYATLLEAPTWHFRFNQDSDEWGMFSYDAGTDRIDRGTVHRWLKISRKAWIEKGQTVLKLTCEDFGVECNLSFVVRVTRGQLGVILGLNVVLATGEPGALLRWELSVETGEVGPANSYQITGMPPLP